MTDEQIYDLWMSIPSEGTPKIEICRFARALLAASAPTPSDKQEAVAFDVWAMKEYGKQAVRASFSYDAMRTAYAAGAAPIAQSAEQEAVAAAKDRARRFVTDFSRDVGFAMSDAQQEVMLNLFLRHTAPIAQSAEQDRIDAERWRYARDNIQEGYELPGGYCLSDHRGANWDATVDAAKGASK